MSKIFFVMNARNDTSNRYAPVILVHDTPDGTTVNNATV